MLIKLKEKIIALSRKNNVTKFMIVYSIITFILLIISYFWNLEPIVSIISIGVIILWTIYGVLYTIRKQEINVIRNNKLINIIIRTLVMIMAMIGSAKISYLISKYFKNKLKK